MLNHLLKLNQKIFTPDIELASMRVGFGEGIVKAAEVNKKVVALCADLTESLHLEKFKQKFPDRFIEVGVAEQNLVTVASGMAAAGKVPFVGSYAVFSPGRNWEQIRTTVCYNDVPVKIIGSHAGVTVGPDGGSHQALEDIALMRVLPRMVVIVPCDTIEARKATEAAAKTDSPTYIRLARDKTPVMTSDDTPFEIGKAQVVFRSEINAINSGEKSSHIHHTDSHNSRVHLAGGKMNAVHSKKTGHTGAVGHCDVGIIATGPSLYRALNVAKKITEEGKSVQVMNLSTIKPLDERSIIKLAQESGALVTVEDHQIAGGMGSAVAECLAKHFPVPIEFIGINDRFGQSGTTEELIANYHIDEQDIYDATHRVMLRK